MGAVDRPRAQAPDGYEAIAALAEGGMGELFVARRHAAGGVRKLVVVKQVRPSYAADPEFEAMFLREAKIAASLDHVNVVQVLDSGVDPGGRIYLAMEYVHGVDLRALLRRLGAGVPLERDHALTIAVGLADGLAYVHGRGHDDGRPLGLVHRDVSPSNVLLSYDGAIKLTDFGVAGASADSLATRSGSIKGKLAYMAPEQARGDRVDARADLYALGVVLYEMTTGRRPFAGLAEAPLLYRKLEADPDDPRALVDGYPEALAAIVMKAMARDPADRYEDAAQMRRALEDFAGTQRGLLSAARLGEYVATTCGRRPLPAGPSALASTPGAAPVSDALDKVQSVLTAPTRARSRWLWVAAVGGLATAAVVFVVAPAWSGSTASPEASARPDPPGDSEESRAPAGAAPPRPTAVVDPEATEPAATPTPGPGKPTQAAPDAAPAHPADLPAEHGDGDGDDEAADGDGGATPAPAPRKASRRPRPRGKASSRKTKSPPPPSIDSPLPFGGS